MTASMQTMRVPSSNEPFQQPQEPILSQQQIDEAAARFQGVEQTAALLEWVVETFGDRWILASSWQHAVIVDHLSKITDNVRVCELDTELLFAETYATRREVIERYGIDVISMRPRLSVAEQGLAMGSNLWESDPDKCCHHRKVIPLRTILGQQDAWLTGLRRSQSKTRKQAHTVERDHKHGIVKINPLAYWDDDALWSYIRENDVPYNPLLTSGYPSIGCFPCTRPVQGEDDPRAGRWAGSEKTECGLHWGPEPS